MSHIDLKFFLSEIPSPPIKYSKLGRQYDQLFSNLSLKKLKEISLRKGVVNSDSSLKPKQIQPNESSPEEGYIPVKTPRQEKFLPSIRKILPKAILMDEIDSNNRLKGSNNATLDNKQEYHFQGTEEEDESSQRLMRYEYIKRMNQRKLKRINNLKKMWNNTPDIGHYSPNYSLVERKVPSILFKGQYTKKQKPNSKISLNLSLIKPNESYASYRKQRKKSISLFNQKDTSNSCQDLFKQKGRTYLTSIIESDVSKSLKPSSTSLTQKHYMKSNKSYLMTIEEPAQTKEKKKEKEKLKRQLSNVVSFKNMKGREIVLKHKGSNCTIPTQGTYTPKYNYIDKDKKCISFNSQFSYAAYKKNIINKSIHHYHYNKDYIVLRLLQQDSGLTDETLVHTSSHKKLKVKENLNLH